MTATDIALRYHVKPTDPKGHRFQVVLTIDQPDPAGQELRLPAWIPGSYMIRDYARNIMGLTAECNGQPITLHKTGKSRWRAEPASGALQVIADIFALDESVRGAHFDDGHFFFNGTCAFLEAVGQADRRCTVHIDAPPGGENWQLATSMRRAGADRWSFGRYEADNYDELIDHPVEIAPQQIREFDVDGIPHAIAIRGRVHGDVGRLVKDLQLICSQHMTLLGAPRDLDRYVFLLNMPGNGYGGLEHRWSSANINARDTLPAIGDSGMSDGYRGLLGLLSHEYFHLWNVKRMKPAVFTPYPLEHETHTELLWVFEGITSYYDDLALVRCGLIDEQSYFELIARTMTRVLRGSGRERQSVAESSFDAWTKFYKQDANARNAIVSYYAKGSLVALALDLELRARGSSLDAVMRACWQRFGETGVGMPERGFEDVVAEVIGERLDGFFSRYVYGTEDPPLDTLLESMGVRPRYRAASGSSDKGGKAAEKVQRVHLGATLVEDRGRTLVQTVANGSPAELAGLSPGDELLAIDDLRMTVPACDRLLSDTAPDTEVTATLFRGDVLYQTSMRLSAAPADTCWIETDDTAHIERRHAWLGKP